MSLINTDPKVMEFFPGVADRKQTEEFVERMQQQFKDKGFCYFAVDKLETREFIGFIGLSEQDFKADFRLGTDIGWRLAQEEWNRGFATEGAKTCLEFAFDKLQLPRVIAICPEINVGSEAVMRKIGMHNKHTFDHPLLEGSRHLQKCVLYEMIRPGSLADSSAGFIGV